MRKAFFNAAGWLLPVLVALVATPWLIRELGAARFGVWALIVMLGALIPTLDLGYSVAAVRELAGARGDTPRIQRVSGELLSLALLLGAMAWALVAWSGHWIAAALNFEQAVSPAEAKVLMGLLGPWIAVAFVNGALTALPRAHEHVGALALLGTASSLGLWIGATALAAFGAGLPQLMSFGLGLQGAMGLALVVLHRRIAGRWPLPVAGLSTLLRSSRFALTSFVGSLTSMATYHADKALVSAFIGPAAAGLYTASANVANKLLGLVAALGGVIYPRVSMLHAGGADRLQVARLYFVSNRILMTLTIALAVVGVVLAERFLLLWLGANVTPGLVLAFRLLIVAYVMASASVVASNILSGRGNAHRGAWFAALGGLMTVVAGWLLIPRLGVAGAGWAGVIGMSQAVVFDLWMERDLRAEHPEFAAGQRRPWLGWLAAGLAAGLVAWLAQGLLAGWIGLLAAGGLGLAAFGAAWFGARFASPEERQIALRLLAIITDKTHDRKSA